MFLETLDDLGGLSCGSAELQQVISGSHADLLSNHASQLLAELGILVDRGSEQDIKLINGFGKRLGGGRFGTRGVLADAERGHILGQVGRGSYVLETRCCGLEPGRDISTAVARCSRRKGTVNTA